jgi:hypothetical protein
MSESRNLVLLLTSGHTVRIQLREDDFTTSLDDDPDIGTPELHAFLQMPAILCTPSIKNGDILMAYIESPVQFGAPGDFQRITTQSPGGTA